MKRGMWWPIGIVVTLGLVVVANIWMAIVASDPSALVVEPDYYQRAVNYDATMRQEAANTQLGWRLVSSLGAVSADSGAELTVELRDGAGSPIQGATIYVVAVHNTIANLPVSATLGDAGRGAYTVRLPMRRAGQWELRFDVRRGSDRFTADMRLDAQRASHT